MDVECIDDADLRRCAGRLQRLLGGIERAFLGAGEGLSDAIARLQGLTATFDSLCARLGGDEVREATRLLEATVATVTDGTGAHGDDGVIARLGSCVNEVAHHLAKVQATMGEVAVLAMNAKIEVSHIDGAGTDFAVFTKEMGTLAASANIELDDMGRELRLLAQQVRSARTGRDAFEEQQKAALAGVGERLRQSLGVVAQRQAAAERAAGDVRDRSYRMAQHVAAAVGALQFGDIARQRIEHVLYALDMAGRIVAGREGHDLSPPERRAAAAAIARLQAKQLSGTAADYRHEVAQVLASLQKLAVEVQEVRHHGLDAFGAASGSRASFLTELRGDLAAAADLLGRAAQAAADTHRVMGQVQAAVGRIVLRTEAIHSIEADMRLMGLNAELKCGRLGIKGRTLRVIAHELRARAGRTAEEAGIAKARLGEITTLAKGLSLGQADDDTLADTAKAELAAATAALDAIAHSLAGALVQLDGDGERAAGLLADVARRLEEQDEFEAGLDAARKELDGVAADGGDIDFRRIEEDILHMQRLYTMASERDIHAQFAGGAAAMHVTPTVSVEDLLF